MKKIATVLVDDERSSLDYLTGQLKHFQRLDVRKAFTDPRLLLGYIEKHPDIQLVVLDKEMKRMDGLDLVAQLPKHVLSVMVTGYREFAVDAFEINIVDYIVKPAFKDRLANTVRRVEERLRLSPSVALQPQDSDFFTVRTATRGAMELIYYDDILYIKSAKDDCLLYFADGTQALTTPVRIGVLEQDLPPDLFMRVHNQYIVHKRYARHYADSMITLRAGMLQKTINVGPTYKDDVLFWMKDRLVGS